MGIFGKLKSKLVGAAIRRQLKNVPKEQQEMLIHAMENNPEVLEKFKQISNEISALKKAGESEFYASIKVAKKHEAELQRLLAGSMGQQKQKVIYKER